MRKPKNIFPYIPTVIAVIALGIALSYSGHATADSQQKIDYAGIEAVIVRGDGSKVEINAVNGTAGDLRILQGGWTPTLCDAQVEVNRNGSTLDIRLIRTGIRLFGQCDITMALELPEGLGVSLDQARTVAQFSGAFSDVRIKSDDAVIYFSGQAQTIGIESLRAVISFSGHANRVDIVGEEATVELAFKGSQDMDGVRINVKKLVANIGYPKSTVLSYLVTARVSVLAPDFPNTADAHPKVEITSDMLKGSIYALKDGGS